MLGFPGKNQAAAVAVAALAPGGGGRGSGTLRLLVLLGLLILGVGGVVGGGRWWEGRKPWPLSWWNAPGWSGQAERMKKTLRIQIPYEPVSLDPLLAEDGVALQMLHFTSLGLVGYDAAGLLRRELAEHYSVSEQGKRYAFRLKPGACWSDGVGLQISDFIAAFQRLADGRKVSKLLPLFEVIEGLKAIRAGQLPLSALGVFEENDQLIVRLEHAQPSFLHALTLPPAFPLRPAILEQAQGLWPEEAPVMGAFQIVLHRWEQNFILRRNPHYRLYAGVVGLAMDEIQLKVIAEDTTAMALFLQGQVDLMTRVSAFDLPRLRQDGHLRVFPFFATFYLSFNVRKAPMNQLPLRQAVASAIHRQEIVDILGSGELPAWSWIPPGLEGYQNEAPWRSLLHETAHEALHDMAQTPAARMNFPELVAGFDSSARNSRIMEKVQADLAKELHWKITLQHWDWKSYLARLASDDPPTLYRMAWLAPIHDPLSHLQVFTSHNPNNFSGWSNSAYDQLVEEVASLEPGPARVQKIQAAQQILREQAIVVPLYHYVQTLGAAKRIENLKLNPFGMLDFEHLTFAQDP